jgi:hypothetical protein
MQSVSTPWGKARKTASVSVGQRSGDRRFATVVELLETARGEQLLRFAYSTDGIVRRGPVTLRARDMERLRAALEREPALREAVMGR